MLAAESSLDPGIFKLLNIAFFVITDDLVYRHQHLNVIDIKHTVIFLLVTIIKKNIYIKCSDVMLLSVISGQWNGKHLNYIFTAAVTVAYFCIYEEVF